MSSSVVTNKKKSRNITTIDVDHDSSSQNQRKTKNPIFIPVLKKNSKVVHGFGSAYFHCVKEAVFEIPQTPFSPQNIPETLKQPDSNEESFYECGQCNDCFRFSNTLEEHKFRRSWILGYWCQNCFLIKCEHVPANKTTCSACVSFQFNKRAYLRSRGLKKGQKAATVKLFFNQCQFFEHLKSHDITTVEINEIMLMPFPVDVKKEDNAKFERACKSIMEYGFLNRLHIMEFLRAQKVEDCWWHPSPSDVNSNKCDFKLNLSEIINAFREDDFNDTPPKKNSVSKIATPTNKISSSPNKNNPPASVSNNNTSSLIINQSNQSPSTNNFSVKYFNSPYRPPADIAFVDCGPSHSVYKSNQLLSQSRYSESPKERDMFVKSRNSSGASSNQISQVSNQSPMTSILTSSGLSNKIYTMSTSNTTTNTGPKISVKKFASESVQNWGQLPGQSEKPNRAQPTNTNTKILTVHSEKCLDLSSIISQLPADVMNSKKIVFIEQNSNQVQYQNNPQGNKNPSPIISGPTLSANCVKVVPQHKILSPEMDKGRSVPILTATSPANRSLKTMLSPSFSSPGIKTVTKPVIKSAPLDPKVSNFSEGSNNSKAIKLQQISSYDGRFFYQSGKKFVIKQKNTIKSTSVPASSVLKPSSQVGNQMPAVNIIQTTGQRNTAPTIVNKIPWPNTLQTVGSNVSAPKLVQTVGNKVSATNSVQAVGNKITTVSSLQKVPTSTIKTAGTKNPAVNNAGNKVATVNTIQMVAKKVPSTMQTVTKKIPALNTIQTVKSRIQSANTIKTVTNTTTTSNSSSYPKVLPKPITIISNSVSPLTPSTSPSESSSSSSCDVQQKQSIDFEDEIDKLSPVISTGQNAEFPFTRYSLRHLSQKHEKSLRIKVDTTSRLFLCLSENSESTSARKFGMIRYKQIMIDALPYLSIKDIQKRIEHVNKLIKDYSKLMQVTADKVTVKYERLIGSLEESIEQAKILKIQENYDSRRNREESEMEEDLSIVYDKQEMEKCSFCKKTKKPSNYISGLSLVSNNEAFYCQCDNWLCSICDTYQGSSRRYNAHVCFHKKRPPFVCPECFKEFSNFDMLEKHVWLSCFHPLFKNCLFGCKICGIDGVISPESLTIHFLIMHSKRRFVCLECKQIFFYEKTCREHQKKNHETREQKDNNHSEDLSDPMEIVICDIGNCIVLKKNFTQHVIDHFGVVKQMFFKCPVCPFSKLEGPNVKDLFRQHVFASHSYILRQLTNVKTVDLVHEMMKQNSEEAVLPMIVNPRTIAQEAFEKGTQDEDSHEISATLNKSNHGIPMIVDVRSEADLNSTTSDADSVPKILEVKSIANDSLLKEPRDLQTRKRKATTVIEISLSPKKISSIKVTNGKTDLGTKKVIEIEDNSEVTEICLEDVCKDTDKANKSVNQGNKDVDKSNNDTSDIEIIEENIKDKTKNVEDVDTGNKNTNKDEGCVEENIAEVCKDREILNKDKDEAVEKDSEATDKPVTPVNKDIEVIENDVGTIDNLDEVVDKDKEDENKNNGDKNNINKNLEGIERNDEDTEKDTENANEDNNFSKDIDNTGKDSEALDTDNKGTNQDSENTNPGNENSNQDREADKQDKEISETNNATDVNKQDKEISETNKATEVNEQDKEISETNKATEDISKDIEDVNEDMESVSKDNEDIDKNKEDKQDDENVNKCIESNQGNADLNQDNENINRDNEDINKDIEHDNKRVNSDLDDEDKDTVASDKVEATHENNVTVTNSSVADKSNEASCIDNKSPVQNHQSLNENAPLDKNTEDSDKNIQPLNKDTENNQLSGNNDQVTDNNDQFSIQNNETMNENNQELNKDGSSNASPHLNKSTQSLDKKNNESSTDNDEISNKSKEPLNKNTEDLIKDNETLTEDNDISIKENETLNINQKSPVDESHKIDISLDLDKQTHSENNEDLTTVTEGNNPDKLDDLSSDEKIIVEPEVNEKNSSLLINPHALENLKAKMSKTFKNLAKKMEATTITLQQECSKSLPKLRSISKKAANIPKSAESSSEDMECFMENGLMNFDNRSKSGFNEKEENETRSDIWRFDADSLSENNLTEKLSDNIFSLVKDKVELTQPPPLARIPQHIINSQSVVESAKRIKKRKRDKIAFNGPTNHEDDVLDFKCHVCGKMVDSSWPVLKSHFDIWHLNEYTVSALNPQLLRISSDYIEGGYKEILSKRYKSDVTPRKRKRRTRFSGKSPEKSSPDKTVGICVKTESVEEDDGMFKCKKCNDKFADMDILRQHISKNHRIKGRYLVCLECGENFVVAPSLQMHLKAFHAIEDPLTHLLQNTAFAPENLEDTEEEDEEVTTEANQCYVCMAVFENKAAVDKHLRVHGMAFLNRKRIEAKKNLNSPEKKVQVQTEETQNKDSSGNPNLEEVQEESMITIDEVVEANSIETEV